MKLVKIACLKTEMYWPFGISCNHDLEKGMPSLAKLN